jgi:lipopolysaccharide biosynthesis protein
MVKPIAFYLPQFHPVAENSEWWGPGFTEWTNVAKARPNFPGHYQPQIPRELGFYDLRMPEVMAAQADLAKSHSVFGFCMYYYWFSGRRILDKPIDVFYKSKIDMNFCFCWANENWTKRWDGGNNEILLLNEHSVENDDRFIEDVLPYMQDDRYIRYAGYPMLLVYRADIMADSRASFDHWRKRAKAAGLPGLFIACVNFQAVENPTDWGADALVEFPPHGYLPKSFCDYPAQVSPDFRGYTLDYRLVMTQSINRREDDFLMFHGAMPSWDNTARRQNEPHIFMNSSPELFEFWLRHQSAKTAADRKNDEKFLFINAWNEWAEGCHLEPCLRHGLKHLEAVRRAVDPDKFLTARPPHDTAISALAAIQSYELGDAKYFTSIETHYREALTEISVLREANRLRERSLKFVVADRLRQHPTLFKLARRGYRMVRGMPAQ